VTPSPPDDDAVRIPIEAELDLHAFAPRDVASVVEEYITAAHAAGFSELRLVHGRGKGIQRGIVQQVLDRHAMVESFADDAWLGATLVKLRTSKVEGRTNVESET
jgi:DNA-nicking Smr family endonuclease